MKVLYFYMYSTVYCIQIYVVLNFFQSMNISSGGKVEKGKAREDGQFTISVDAKSDLFQ